jgi:hypothetical protein
MRAILETGRQKMECKNLNLLSAEELAQLGFSRAGIARIAKNRPFESVLDLLFLKDISLDGVRTLLAQGILAGVRDKLLLTKEGLPPTDLGFVSFSSQDGDEGDERMQPYRVEFSDGGFYEIRPVGKTPKAVIPDCTTKEQRTVSAVGANVVRAFGPGETKDDIRREAKLSVESALSVAIGDIVLMSDCRDPNCTDISLTFRTKNLVSILDRPFIEPATGNAGWQARYTGLLEIDIVCVRKAGGG